RADPATSSGYRSVRAESAGAAGFTRRTWARTAGVALRLVVVDPQRSLLVRQRGRDALHGGHRLVAADLHRRHALAGSGVLEVHGVPRQHDEAGLGQVDA